MLRPLLFAFLILIAILTAFGSSACLSTSKAEPVRLAEVSLGNLHSGINTNGKVEAEKVFELRAPFAARCVRIYAREGAILRTGDPVIALDDSSLRSELAGARAELASAEVDLRDVRRGAVPEELNQAEAEVERLHFEVEAARKVAVTNEDLLRKEAISRFEYEESQRALARAEQSYRAALTRRDDLERRFGDLDKQRAESRLAAARSRIAHLESSIARAVVRSPAEGTLYEFGVKEGAFLNTGDLVGLLADLSRIRVRAFIDEPEMGRLSSGSGVVIRWDAWPNESWQGKIAHLPSQVVSRGTRSVAEVLCDISDSKHLLVPNINVDVEIMIEQGPQVPTLPRNCVYPEGRSHFVWMVKDGVAEKRMIQTGRSGSNLIEVTGGISLGDRVVVPGDVAITEGMKLRIVE